MKKLVMAMKIAKGNPGALEGMMKILESSPIMTLNIMSRLIKCPSIEGGNFYVLYSDLCNKDVEKVAYLCQSDISNELLEDACNRQDYSGRKLVVPFLEGCNEKSESEMEFFNTFSHLI